MITESINQVNSALDADDNGVVQMIDASLLFDRLDKNFDSEVSKKELQDLISDKTLLTACYEDALRDPQYWLRQNAPSSQTKVGIYGVLQDLSNDKQDGFNGDDFRTLYR